METQATRPPPRARTRSSFFRSSSYNNSHKRKESLLETAAEKRKTHMSQTTKANPNAAINEAQPVALALEAPTIAGLHNIRCNDIHGNPINDPDRSNPTRWRMERPLDTIKSFEIAIDRAHAHRQSSYYQNGPQGMQSRRASSHMGHGQGHPGYDNAGRFSHQNGHPGGYGSQRDSYAESTSGGGYGQNGYNNQAPHPGYGNRMQSDPGLARYGAPGVYPAVGNSRSKDTLNTGGSNSSEHWNNSTGPTSEEGSLEQANGMTRPIPPQHSSPNYNEYGYLEDDRGRGKNAYSSTHRPGVQTSQSVGNYGNGYSPNGYSPNGYSPNGNSPNGYSPHNSGPALPMKDNRPLPPSKSPIALNSSGIPNGAVQSPDLAKRGSWLKRRFSKNK